MEHKWLTAAEAAEYCRISYWYFLELVRKGEIYHPNRKGKYLFKNEWLDFYIEGRLNKPNQKPPEKHKYKNF